MPSLIIDTGKIQKHLELFIKRKLLGRVFLMQSWVYRGVSILRLPVSWLPVHWDLTTC